jgi:hypothetical protein
VLERFKDTFDHHQHQRLPSPLGVPSSVDQDLVGFFIFFVSELLEDTPLKQQEVVLFVSLHVLKSLSLLD